MHKHQSRFTLVELLVVIAIVGILASMLLPSLRNALESARQIDCTNNQRQLSMVTVLYAEQFFNWLPPYAYDATGSGKWVYLYTDQLRLVTSSYADVWYNNSGSDGRGIFDCPNDQRKLNVSYYINRQITGEVMTYSKWRKYSDISAPSHVLLFADGWTGNYNTGGYFLDHFTYVTTQSYQPDFRHAGRSNVTFVDGHVSACSVGDIPIDTRKNLFWYGAKN